MSESLLPPSATSEEVAIDLATARVGDVPTPVRTMWNADTCAANLLPWLAWAFSVDEWDVTWSDVQKRSAIKASYDIHRRKGTIGAVRRALTSLGLTSEVVEWFDEVSASEPYTFRIILGVGQDGVGLEPLAKVIGVVNAAKNLRSHLVGIEVVVETQGEAFFAGFTAVGNEITVEPWAPSEAGIMTEDGLGILTEDGKLLITE